MLSVDVKQTYTQFPKLGQIPISKVRTKSKLYSKDKFQLQVRTNSNPEV